MSASASDLLLKVGTPGTATTLSSPGYTQGNTSITVGSTTNWPSDTGVVFAIDVATVVNGLEVQTAGTYCEFIGVVSSGTSITSVALVNGTPQDYAAGSLTRVYIPVSAERENRIVTWGLVEHTELGRHTLTSSSTITSSKVITALSDTNGNELIRVSPTSSAVNDFTVTNAATGNSPQISATGDDANIGLKLAGKGTGAGDFGSLMANAVQTQVNAGTAGGTMWWINLGGLKILWGVSSGHSQVNSNSATFTWTLPTSFFSTLQTVVPTQDIPGSATNAAVSVGLTAKTTTTVTTQITNQTGGTQTITHSIFVIGT